jgi:hypothetical protein
MIDWPNGPKKIQYLGGTKSVARTTRDEVRGPDNWRIATNLCPKIASFQRRDLVLKGHGIGFRGHHGSKDRCPCPTNSLNKCAPASPHCPACGQVMRLARITSRFGDLPDVYTFECRACGVSHIEPALSASIAGALQLGACRKDLWTLATSETYDA